MPKEGREYPLKFKIADLGLARTLNFTQNETSAYTAIGTVDYVQPQVFERKGYTHKADVYSLGCTFFHMLTGFVPFSDGRAAVYGEYYFPRTVKVSLKCLEILTLML